MSSLSYGTGTVLIAVMEVKAYKKNKQLQENYNAPKIYLCHDFPHLNFDSDV